MIYEAQYDLKRDFIIDEKDIAAFSTVYGESEKYGMSDLGRQADFDKSGTVDIDDFTMLAARQALVSPDAPWLQPQQVEPIEPPAKSFPWVTVIIGGLVLAMFAGNRKKGK